MSLPSRPRPVQAETVLVRIEILVDPAQLSPDERRSIAVSAYTTLHQRFNRRPWFLGISYPETEGA